LHFHFGKRRNVLLKAWPKKIPGKNTGDALIKDVLTIKPYPMKKQSYAGGGEISVSRA
jgi:hypothetical protein